MDDPVLRSRVSVYASKFRTLPRLTDAIIKIDYDDSVVR
jgi:hypothetical protein